jgi:vacuolar-type H+-ATPase subunit B/Vma2
LGLIEAVSPNFHPPIKVLTMEEVDQLEKDWVAHLKSKLKEEYEMKRRASKDKLESETTRLLSVLARKEERFVLEICEKDRIIECYEDILWHLENKLDLQPKNDIAKRVIAIMAVRKQPVVASQKHIKGKDDCLLF